MSQVAGADYRGPWKGLAPMRLIVNGEPKENGEPKKPLLLVDPEFPADALMPLSRITAFPNCYLTPIGWVAGVVVDIKSHFTFDRIPALVHRLRTEAAFLFHGRSVTLERLLRELHETIRSVLVVSMSQRTIDWPRPYLAVSPIHFDRQDRFHGLMGVDQRTIMQILDDEGAPEAKPALVRRHARAIAVTVLNRGSFLMTHAPQERPAAPRCALSNLKDSLLITALMHRFHKAFRGHRALAAQEMCDEVEKTMSQLLSSWDAPHFHQICDAHTGIQKMIARKTSIEYRFDRSKIYYPAIGPSPRVITESSGKLRRDAPAEEPQMSSFNFNNNTMTNTAIGDHATIIQNLDASSLAADLAKVRDAAANRASTPDEHADAARLKDAAAEAQAGRKEGAISHLRQLGDWGWSLLKELISATTAETIKKLVVG